MSELDDLARLIGPSPGEDIRLVQGVIRSWNPNTFENEVDVDGVIRRNLRVGSGIEALTYQPGDVVLVQQWFPGGRKGELGVGTSWIVGRILTPGTGAAEQAIAFMRTALAKRISSEIFAERVHAASVDTAESTTSTTFTDLDTVGPVVDGVEVSELGLAIVTLSATVTVANAVGIISFEMSGATSRAASTDHFLGFGVAGAGTASVSGSTGSSKQFVLTGLNPGIHRFVAKYASVTGSEVFFQHRTMSVIAF